MTFTLTPPGYPGSYYNLTHCIWLIEAPTGYAVQINVGEFRTHRGGDSGCADYLEVRIDNITDGESEINKKIKLTLAKVKVITLHVTSLITDPRW